MPPKEIKPLADKNLEISLKQEVNDKSNRRQLLMGILRFSGQVTLASGTIYGVSLLTSKQGITAGAK